MHPILFSLFGFNFYSFGFCISLGILLGAVLLTNRTQKALGQQSIAWMIQTLFAVIIIGFIGARVFYCFYYPEKFAEAPIAVLLQGGLVWYGGLFAGWAGLIALAKQAKQNVLQIMDLVAPSLMVGLGFGRIGCFLSGCCFGSPCHVPWAVSYPVGHLTHGMLVHPTPLYESLGAFALAGLTIGLEKAFPNNHRGVASGVLLFGYGILRFGLEYLRGDKLMVATLSASQWMSIAGIAMGLGLLIGWSIQQKRQQPMQSA
ncbi:MAG: prolipoprotein diacylglyceryl transferase [Candidatus Melainabacteria bacterium]|jgi:phosphatidylglycerol:prolipoprotein diacylglycerol transferase|nr:prolipoprotein diacylglyceryl transferase [Candidatus Melainabacteria bacterium]